VIQAEVVSNFISAALPAPV